MVRVVAVDAPNWQVKRIEHGEKKEKAPQERRKTRQRIVVVAAPVAGAALFATV